MTKFYRLKMKYRLDLSDETVLWSEDVSDLCYYLKSLGLITMSESYFIIKQFAYYGVKRCAGNEFIINKET